MAGVGLLRRISTQATGRMSMVTFLGSVLRRMSAAGAFAWTGRAHRSRALKGSVFNLFLGVGLEGRVLHTCQIVCCGIGIARGQIA